MKLFSLLEQVCGLSLHSCDVDHSPSCWTNPTAH